MKGYDFSKINSFLSNNFDTDYIDIKRDINGELKEIYSNIPCHIAFKSQDNPDPNTVDISPIIQTLNIHMNNWVDIKNDDYIVAKRVVSGKVEKVYSGRCGNPTVSQARKKVNVVMRATDDESGTDIPIDIEYPCKITISFKNNGVDIADSIDTTINKGDIFTYKPININGYNVSACYIDGVKQEGLKINLETSENSYSIIYVYTISEVASGFKYLVNSLYTANDGSMRIGWHLYKEILIKTIIKVNDVDYDIICENKAITHEDTGNVLSITLGAKLVLTPQKTYIKVKEIISKNGDVNFIGEIFEPNDEELNAYVTRWYN